MWQYQLENQPVPRQASIWSPMPSHDNGYFPSCAKTSWTPTDEAPPTTQTLGNCYYADVCPLENDREATPPLVLNMHWVPDELIKELSSLPSELNHSPLSSMSNESFSHSPSDAPDLIDPNTPSLSARRYSRSLSLSPLSHTPPLALVDTNFQSFDLSRTSNASPTNIASTRTTSSSSSQEEGRHRRTRFTLAEIVELGVVAQYAKQDTNSRFLQKEIRYAQREDRQRALEQMLPHVSELSCDSHGNYVIQRFVEHGHPQQRSQICTELLRDVWKLTRDEFGCRVIQKVVEYADVPCKLKVFEHLVPHLSECIADDNGNYVIQKIVAEIPPHMLEPIYSVFRGRTKHFCTHPYGCRIVQRLLQHASLDFKTNLCEAIVHHAKDLAKHTWGNYVIQYVLDAESPQLVERVTNILLENLCELSFDRLASNVLEKCIQSTKRSTVDLFFEEFVNRSNDELVEFMSNQYGNFVAGTLIQKGSGKAVYKRLYKRMKRFNMIREIKSSQYGRHVWIKMDEKLRRKF